MLLLICPYLNLSAEASAQKTRKQAETKRRNASRKSAAATSCQYTGTGSLLTAAHIRALECFTVPVQYVSNALSHGSLFYYSQSLATFYFQSVEIQASPHPHVCVFSVPSVNFLVSLSLRLLAQPEREPAATERESITEAWDRATGAVIFGRTSGTYCSDHPLNNCSPK